MFMKEEDDEVNEKIDKNIPILGNPIQKFNIRPRLRNKPIPDQIAFLSPDVLSQLPQIPLLKNFGYYSNKQAPENIVLTSHFFGSLPTQKITKLKMYKKSPLPDHRTLKVQTQNSEHIFYFEKNLCYQYAYGCFWAKMRSMGYQLNINQQTKSYTRGTVLQRKGILSKNWVFSDLRLHGFKYLSCYDGPRQVHQTKGPKMSIFSCNQFWTRFQTIQVQDQEKIFVVFKIWDIFTKIQYAVPVSGAMRWFKGFCLFINHEDNKKI